MSYKVVLHLDMLLSISSSCCYNCAVKSLRKDVSRKKSTALTITLSCSRELSFSRTFLLLSVGSKCIVSTSHKIRRFVETSGLEHRCAGRYFFIDFSLGIVKNDIGVAGGAVLVLIAGVGVGR